MLKSVLKRALGLGTAVVEGARIEGESTIVSARPRRAALRCPACGRRCDGHDTLPARRWRAPDVGSARCCVEYAPRRVERPEHGVRAEAVPWARAAPSSVYECAQTIMAKIVDAEAAASKRSMEIISLQADENEARLARPELTQDERKMLMEESKEIRDAAIGQANRTMQKSWQFLALVLVLASAKFVVTQAK